MKNAARRAVLTWYRGYPDKVLFAGFPTDITWRRVHLEAADIERLRYANDAHGDRLLVTLSEGSLLVADGARRFTRTPPVPGSAHIGEVLAAFRRGQVFAPLIAVEASGAPPVPIEGHSRATAYAIEHRPDTVEALIGSCASLAGWAWF